ncbi:PorP/SprF family type IX secretion system membrane protein [Marivirga arenosa]|uniref:Type IX secretion system membrane protein PorP/SprF n=1 Tax=Marivirga arenosa TaxID=3059076 RepID=A0AA51N8X2_9BACT|nr:MULTISPECIES: type IX secretion system membrane protein PorP/SprF [unclassified Marivirga]WMN06675.1 type IX secretion system membrane protein PorP/SprF [Marivirga sp. ABR2-2]WNB16988.1 type IX secretion system membrane protein PorP/SprF [Marivirga sp. BKB1-2]
MLKTRNLHIIQYTAIVLMVAILLNPYQVKAQDFQFSQYHESPLYLNPAFTGLGKMHRITLNSRVQWPSLPKAYVTNALAYDYNMDYLSSGFGLMLTRDVAGSGNLGNTNASFLYSYRIGIADKLVLSTGLQFAYNFTGLNQNGLTLGDQLLDNRGISFDSELSNIQNIQYFDFAGGVLLYGKSLWAGLALHHLTQPEISLIGDSNPLRMKISAHGGIRIPLYRGSTKLEYLSSIAPSFVYKRQGINDQLDLGINWHYDPISAGLWYRGVPLGKTTPNESLYDRDALIFKFGLLFPDFQVGYSYDFTISDLGGASGGAHEISIIFDFEAKLAKKRKKQFLPCPTF